MSTVESQDQVERLKFLLEQLNLTKYSSLSDILHDVFDSGDKFNEFIDSLNTHISSEEVISKKLCTLYDYINELPKEEDIKNLIPIDKLQQISNIVENHVNCVCTNNEKALQLDILYTNINAAYTKLKTDVDSINNFMEEFKNNPSYTTRFLNDAPITSSLDLNVSFTTKVDTSVLYEQGDSIKFIEIREDMLPMTFYTPMEFIKGYIQNDTIVLDQGMKKFYMFSSETEVYDISFVNSVEPFTDSQYDIEQYQDYEFELNIYIPGELTPLTTTFSYYGTAMGVTFTPGSKFDIKYKGDVSLLFPMYKKIKFTEIKTNVVPSLI
jgi:hypothetical protein